jgi:hypothetical protein
MLPGQKKKRNKYPVFLQCLMSDDSQSSKSQIFVALVSCGKMINRNEPMNAQRAQCANPEKFILSYLRGLCDSLASFAVKKHNTTSLRIAVKKVIAKSTTRLL